MSNDVDERGWPLPPRPWQYSDRIIAAMAAAAQIRANQVRKGTTVPYLSHLLGSCSIALDHGADEDPGSYLKHAGVPIGFWNRIGD